MATVTIDDADELLSLVLASFQHDVDELNHALAVAFVSNKEAEVVLEYVTDGAVEGDTLLVLSFQLLDVHWPIRMLPASQVRGLVPHLKAALIHPYQLVALH